jgi:DNA-binding transcriptional LysR family regulator
MLTLRQIEVIRAIIISGTVNGAAELLHVSAPGVSRVMKHTESVLGMRLFQRRHGRYIPTPEAKHIFDQINQVYAKVEDLHYIIDKLHKGTQGSFSFGSVPSIAQYVIPRATARARAQYPDLFIDIDILKIEQAVDYLLLGRGELVALSYRFEHPNIGFTPLAPGQLVGIVPAAHALSKQAAVSVHELLTYPLIGIDPNDPYGRIIAGAFHDHGADYHLSIQARFGQTVAALVRNGLGVAVLDEFSVAGDAITGIRIIPLQEKTEFQTYVAAKADEPLSIYAESMIGFIQREMRTIASKI